MTRVLLWLHDQRLALIAKYRTWVLCADLRREQQPAKRRTP